MATPPRKKTDTVHKFDAVAADYERRRYRHPAAIAYRQAAIVSRWCGRLPAGSTILELGCANGFVTTELARRGYAVTGLDLSPAMIETARSAGVKANFVVGDLDEIDRLGLHRFDAVIGFLATLFHYSERPFETIERLAALQPRKLIVDLHRRDASLDDAVGGLQRLGFAHVAWRAYLAPNRVPLPGALYSGLGVLERRPLRALTVRLKDPNLLVCGTRP
jgi:SAM-dependent methyltransferase